MYITDKTGKQFFKASTSPMSTASEIKNLKRHIALAKKHPDQYKFVDVNTMKIVLDGYDYNAPSDIDADVMLRELGL